EQDVGVGTDGETAFLREHTEDFGGVGAHHFYEFVKRNFTFSYAFREQQFYAVFNARGAVRDLREIVFAHFLLLPEKRTMVRSYNLQQTSINARPKRHL